MLSKENLRLIYRFALFLNGRGVLSLGRCESSSLVYNKVVKHTRSGEWAQQVHADPL